VGNGAVIVGVLVVRVGVGVTDSADFVHVFVTDSTMVMVGVGDVYVLVKVELMEYVPVHETVHVGEIAELSERVGEGVERENCEREPVIVWERPLIESVRVLILTLQEGVPVGVLELGVGVLERV